MSHFTTPTKARRVAPYRPPTLFGDDDRGPRHDLPSQARPATAGEGPGHRARLTLAIDGVDYRARVEIFDPGDGRPVQHAIDLEHTRADRCRVAYHPDDGLVGTCDAWSAEEGCLHANAAYVAGLFPELAILPVAATEGGPACR